VSAAKLHAHLGAAVHEENQTHRKGAANHHHEQEEA
jgi:hypothetical protein